MKTYLIWKMVGEVPRALTKKNQPWVVYKFLGPPCIFELLLPVCFQICHHISQGMPASKKKTWGGFFC